MSKSYTNYIQEFADFMEEFDRGVTGAIKIAAIGCKFTRYLADCGKDQFNYEVLYNLHKRDVICGKDGDSDKPISAAKADVIADASEEYKKYKEAKTDYESLNQIIAALARLQKATMSEMEMSGV